MRQAPDSLKHATSGMDWLDRVRADTVYRKILDDLPVAIYATDTEGRITYYNEAAVTLWGCRPELLKSEWCGSWKLFRIDGTPLKHADCPMAVAVRTRQAVRGVEAYAERPDGSRVRFRPYPTPMFDDEGTFIGAVNLLVDVTEARRDDERARRLVSIVESSDDAIISEGLDGTIQSWNRGAERLFGYGAEEVIGRPVTVLSPPHRPDEGIEIIARIRSGQTVDHYETVRRHKNGRLIHVSLTVSPVYDEQGAIIGASKIAREITERLRAEEHARRLASIVESSDDAIVSESLEGRIESWNRGAERLFGYKAEEVIGKPVTILSPAGKPDDGIELIRRIRQGEIVEHYETMRRRKDGSEVPVSLTVSPVKDERGRIVAASKIARDITERHRADEQQKMVLAEMEHRIKNTLATVQAIARQTLSTASPAERSGFIARLRSLSEAHKLLSHEHWNRALFSDVVERALGAFQDAGQSKILLEGTDEIWLSADRSLQLTMVLHELATNAVKYGALSSPAGRVRVNWSRRSFGRCAMTWVETGGPPVQEPDHKGFGSRLIDRALAGLGRGRIFYRPEGLVCLLVFAR